jgi:hypothetical protein
VFIQAIQWVASLDKKKALPTDDHLVRIAGLTAAIMERLVGGLPVFLLFFLEEAKHFAAAVVDVAADHKIVADVYDSMGVHQAAVGENIETFFKSMLQREVKINSKMPHRHQIDATSCGLYAASYLIHRAHGYSHEAYCQKSADDIHVLVEQLRIVAIANVASDAAIPTHLLECTVNDTSISHRFQSRFKR